ncbi:MAG: YdeI/OmpD-associated family protein [Candidatus Thermoplasmatota archaeon]
MNLEDAVLFHHRNEWRLWLENHHRTKKEIWLLHYKKQAKKPFLNHIDAVEEALCFGWIDSKLKKIDDERFILKYTPRKPKSVWSKINKEKAEILMQSGKMTQAGLEKIEEAKQQGLWDIAYTNKVREQIPADLTLALQKDQIAWTNFQQFANSYRNMYCGWVRGAKTFETRKKRISEVVRRSRLNKKPGIE